MRRRYPREDEILPAKDELAKTKTAAEAQGKGAAIGKGIGAVAGGLGGAVLGAAGAAATGVAAPLTVIPMITGGAATGAGLGAGLGEVAGGQIGQFVGENDQAAADELGEKRARLLKQFELRRRALDELLAQR